ncbi:type II toxin-antitoxin system RelE/ParE family toxin [Flavobacterium cupreum]|uniref:Type II toxin-antitoxin system RelE/ParE family toxin n=2 Tax=Flavobacterium TaxID=237 RepID=A0A434A5L8_9FLAO|nr:type II toxin-antitoxin system RelE/ParE family toxin [Flavobacterium cupreum]RUT69701.1 type II toxin-antitoxin system RelE/ParE family toxin [Flavobacterium cupreum]
MSNIKIKIFWTANAKQDLKEIYISIKNKISKETALKIRDELFDSPNHIVFAEQFQLDEYRLDCRRIIVRNFKILYQIKDDSIFIIKIFNSLQNEIKSLK